MEIFDFLDYRDWLKKKINFNKNIKGFRSRLSHQGGFHPSFLSQVLGGTQDLSLEHGIRLAKEFSLSSQETEYLLELIQRSRSGSSDLSKFHQKRLNDIRTRHRNIEDLVSADELATQLKSKYYSSWIYAAIHVGVSVFSSPKQLAKRFKLDLKLTTAVLKSLKRMKLAEDRSGRWFLTSESVHVNKGSHDFLKNNMNWKNYAIQRMQSLNSDHDIHYNSVISLSKEDSKKLRKMVLDFIAEKRKVVEQTEPEEIFHLMIDYHEV